MFRSTGPEMTGKEERQDMKRQKRSRAGNGRRPLLVAGCIAATLWLPGSGQARPGEWAKSYRLETYGQYAQAAGVMESLIAQGEERAFALLRLGWLNYLQGNHHDAIRNYQRALEINPQSFTARLGITLPLMAQRRWLEVKAQAEWLIARSPWHPTAHKRLLAAEQGLRSWRSLAKHAQDLSAHYPDDADALIYLARARAWLGEPEKAREAYVRLLRRYPENIEAKRYLKGTAASATP